MRCTIQVWTTARGNTAVIASGKPLSPSTTAIRTSWVPRLRSSVITRSQNFAPSVCSIHSPRISLWPEQRTPIARYTPRHFSVADFYPQRVEEHHGIGRFQPVALPRGRLLEHGVGYRAHQVRSDLDPVE